MYMQDVSVFAMAVIFVALNGLTMLAWAAAQGYKMKPTAFAFLVGAVGNLMAGSVTPVSGQSSILTVSHHIKNVNERMTALLLAVVVMVPLGLTGGVTRIADWAGPAVVNGMMAGVGLMVAGIAFDMMKTEKRTGWISFLSALAAFVLFRQLFPAGHTQSAHVLVYVIAVSITVSSLDFVFLQKRRVSIEKMARDSGYTGDMEQNENPKFWTKEYWSEFKLMKPKFSVNMIMFALAFICLNIGTNIAFGNITAGMGGHTQNMDHLTVINSLADVPSVIFGGAPVGAIISATAAAPWPVAAGVVMMLLCALLLFLGLMTRAIKYIPVASIAGFLFIIGFFSTFVPNLRNAIGISANPALRVAEVSGALERAPEAIVAMGVTALTKNPFFGLAAGVAVRFVGSYFGL